MSALLSRANELFLVVNNPEQERLSEVQFHQS